MYKYAPYLLLVPVMLVSFLPGSALLGLWESMTFYHTFGAVDAPLSFLIAPRANIGGQGYAFLEMARAAILELHLPLKLSTFRIPALFFGIVSLILFFTICKRYFGRWSALGATALLACNEVFFQAEHSMTVLVISGAALLFVVERLQALEVAYWNWKEWVGLVIAIALVALHYGPVRIFTIILVVLWFVKAHFLLRKMPGKKEILRGIWTIGGYSAAAFVLIMVMLDYRNLMSLLRFKTFLFPRSSEVMELTGDAGGLGATLKTLGVNLQILAESIFGYVGNFHSAHSSYLVADFRYPLIGWMVLPFVICGLIVLIAWKERRTTIFATPWGNIIALFLALSAPLLFSHVTFSDNGLVATLSSHRMYFLLFPLHLSVAAFLHWLGVSNVRNTVKYAVGVCVALVCAGSVVKVVHEYSRFEKQVFAPTWQMHGTEIVRIWDDKMPNLDRRGYFFLSHFQQHAQYANIARKMAASLRKDQGVRRLVFVDVNKFSESPISPIALDYITNRNFHSVFLALYAGEAGLNINPIIMVDPQRVPVSPYLMSGLAYKGKPREYSALTQLDDKGRVIYEQGTSIIPEILQVTGSRSYDLLVTTPEEEAGARKILNDKHIPFEYVRLDPVNVQ